MSPKRRPSRAFAEPAPNAAGRQLEKAEDAIDRIVDVADKDPALALGMIDEVIAYAAARRQELWDDHRFDVDVVTGYVTHRSWPAVTERTRRRRAREARKALVEG